MRARALYCGQQARLDELEAVANKLQADLLASLGTLNAAAGAVVGGGGEAKAAPGSGFGVVSKVRAVECGASRCQHILNPLRWHR